MSTRRRTAEVVSPAICLLIARVGCGTENSAPSLAALPQSDLPPRRCCTGASGSPYADD